MLCNVDLFTMVTRKHETHHRSSIRSSVSLLYDPVTFGRLKLIGPYIASWFLYDASSLKPEAVILMVIPSSLSLSSCCYPYGNSFQLMGPFPSCIILPSSLKLMALCYVTFYELYLSSSLGSQRPFPFKLLLSLW